MNIKNLEEQIKKNWKVLAFVGFFLIFLLIDDKGDLAPLKILFGVLTLVSMLLIVASEVGSGAKKHGWKNEIVETVISIALVLLFWVGLQILLSTPTPASAIVTCSMLPDLERGDLVIVQGSEVTAYEIDMSREEFDKLNSFVTKVQYQDQEFEVLGSMHSYCSQVLDPACELFGESPQEFVESRGPMEFHYSQCSLKNLETGEEFNQPCVTSVFFKGEEYGINLDHDTIIYVPEQGSYFSLVGDIIHRAYFKVNVEGEEYYLAKGDNNPILDIQIYDYGRGSGNVAAYNLNGKQLFRIPYVGYLRLLLALSFEAPAQCSTNLIY